MHGGARPTPESPGFIKSGRIRQHSQLHTKVLPGYPLAYLRAFSSIDKAHAEVIAGKAPRRRDDMELGKGARLFCDLGCIRIRRVSC